MNDKPVYIGNSSKLEYGKISIYNKNKEIGWRIIFTFLITVFSLSMLLPFLWMLSASFKRPLDIFNFPIKWIPRYWYPENYMYIFSGKINVLLMYFNSIKITCINVIGSVFITSLAAYAYAKMKFKGKNILFLSIIATLMIPNQVTYVPKFVLFAWFGLIDTHASLILPGLFAAYGLFLLRQYFMQVPDALVESAVVDGAGDLTIWWKIMMPIAKPAIMTFVILVFSHHWNDYEAPLIFIRNKKLATLTLGLANFTDENGRMYHYILAMAAVSILPIFSIFLVGQKYFIKGLTAGAIKG